MKKLLLSVAALGCIMSAYGQNTFPASGPVGIGTGSTPLPSGNSPLTVKGTIGVFDGTLDGSLYQRSVIYSDPGNGLYFDAAKTSTSQRLNIAFGWRGEATSTAALFIQGSTKNVGIGTTTPGSFKLAVEGKIGAREVNVTATNPFPDYVFESAYKLRPLGEVETYVQQHKHLPEIPSAAEVAKNGINLGEMDALLLKKIEEITLYVIELKKENEVLKQQVQALRQQD